VLYICRVSVKDLKNLKKHLDHEIILLIERISKNKNPPTIPTAYNEMLNSLPQSESEEDEEAAALDEQGRTYFVII